MQSIAISKAAIFFINETPFFHTQSIVSTESVYSVPWQISESRIHSQTGSSMKITFLLIFLVN